MYSVDKVYDSNFNKFRVTTLDFQAMKKNSGDPQICEVVKDPKTQFLSTFDPMFGQNLPSYGCRS